MLIKRVCPHLFQSFSALPEISETCLVSPILSIVPCLVSSSFLTIFGALFPDVLHSSSRSFHSCSINCWSSVPSLFPSLSLSFYPLSILLHSPKWSPPLAPKLSGTSLGHFHQIYLSSLSGCLSSISSFSTFGKTNTLTTGGNKSEEWVHCKTGSVLASPTLRKLVTLS